MLAEELSLGTLILADGARMPRLGFGTAGSKITATVIGDALRAGLRLLDTAAFYKNERQIGNALQSSGIERAKLFVVSKAWPFEKKAGKDRSDRAPTVSAKRLTSDVEAHVAALKVNYLDLLLLHWPSGALVSHWEALIAMRRAGTARSIGLSNANERHLEMLRTSSPTGILPALVQTELSPVKADARVTGDLEPLVQYCAQHSIALMSHSPIKAALKDANANRLAAARNVSVPLLMLRYGLQRGFAMIFASHSPGHIRSNLAVFDFELSAEDMRQMACWRGEMGCANLTAAVGVQVSYDRRAEEGTARNYLSLSAWVTPHKSRHDACVPVAPGEPDPVTLSKKQSAAERCSAELRAAPQLAVAAAGERQSIGSIEEYQRHPDRTRGGCNGKRCDFCLNVTRPSGERYSALVRDLASQLQATLADSRDSFRMMDENHGYSAQHVVSVRPGRRHTRRFNVTLHNLVEEHITPLLAEHAFVPGAQFVLKKATASRNANDFPPEKYGRTRSMLWHVDGLREGNIKVILYLSDVDHQHGCMVAMRRRESGAPFLAQPALAGRFGAKQTSAGYDSLPILPALWVSELASKGYQPVCLDGPAGTLVLFDVNIVHRGSRPSAGKHRDFVLLEFCVVGSGRTCKAAAI